MEFLTIEKDEKILIIAPHPDDECIGAGGILCKYHHNCSVLVLSMGEQGQGKNDTVKTAEIRKGEFEEEMRYAGIKDYYFLNYPDGQLIYHTDMLEDFDLTPFTKIFVTSESDNHPDHKAAYVSLMNAIKLQNISAEIYTYEVHNPLLSPTHCLDITSCIDRKLELISFHRSQTEVYPYDKYAYTAGKYRGMLLRNPDGLYEVYEYIEKNQLHNDTNNNIANEQELQKFKQYYWTLTRWIELKNKGYSVIDNLSGYRKIAVYGYAEVGKLLVDEIRNSNKCELVYVFDKKQYGKNNVICPSPQIEKPDCVIVTAIASFESIKKELEQYGYSNIISLKELVIKEKSTL